MEVVEVEVVEVTLEEPADAVVAGAADKWGATHSGGVEALAHPLLKRAKPRRAGRPNALLDAVRRHKGRPTAAQVLHNDEALTASWTAVLHDALGERVPRRAGHGRRSEHELPRFLSPC